MNRQDAIALYRAGFGLLTVIAIATQFLELAGRGVLDPVHFLSYFTIDSNLLAAGVFLYLAVRRGERTSGVEVVRGAAVVYMAITGAVFTLLLSGTDVDTAVPWVNDVVHSVMPLVVVADWVFDPPRARITAAETLSWLLFPAVWLAYTLAKGPIVRKYPYPFLDPANGGYGTVAVYAAAILAGMLAVSFAVQWVANAGDARRDEAMRGTAPAESDAQLAEERG